MSLTVVIIGAICFYFEQLWCWRSSSLTHWNTFVKSRLLPVVCYFCFPVFQCCVVFFAKSLYHINVNCFLCCRIAQTHNKQEQTQSIRQRGEHTSTITKKKLVSMKHKICMNKPYSLFCFCVNVRLKRILESSCQSSYMFLKLDQWRRRFQAKVHEFVLI